MLVTFKIHCIVIFFTILYLIYLRLSISNSWGKKRWKFIWILYLWMSADNWGWFVVTVIYYLGSEPTGPFYRKDFVCAHGRSFFWFASILPVHSVPKTILTAGYIHLLWRFFRYILGNSSFAKIFCAKKELMFKGCLIITCDTFSKRNEFKLQVAVTTALGGIPASFSRKLPKIKWR